MSGASVRRPFWRRSVWLRAATTAVSITLIVLWVRFETDLIQGAGSPPAPGGIMLPLLFCTLSLGAMLAAWRGEGAPVAIAGGISLFPVGLAFTFYPGPLRWIGLLDGSLIVLGILLMRAHDGE